MRRLISRAAGVAALALLPERADAQLFERLGLDKLQLTSLGLSVGSTHPSQVEATRVYALQADYGEIAPGWRVVFGASYWNSDFRRDVLQTFEDSLRSVIIDPAADDTIRLGRVHVSDIALGVNLHWVPARFRATALRPYLGGGLSAHVINAEGGAIDGTFVERALDYIASGISGTVGAELAFLPHLAGYAEARMDLLSGVRFASLRVGGSYLFSSQRAPASP